MTLLTIEDEKFAEGVAFGDKRGEQRAQQSIYDKLVKSGKLTEQEAAELTGWNGNTAYSLQ